MKTEKKLTTRSGVSIVAWAVVVTGLTLLRTTALGENKIFLLIKGEVWIICAVFFAYEAGRKKYPRWAHILALAACIIASTAVFVDMGWYTP